MNHPKYVIAHPEINSIDAKFRFAINGLEQKGGKAQYIMKRNWQKNGCMVFIIQHDITEFWGSNLLPPPKKLFYLRDCLIHNSCRMFYT